MPVIMNLPRPQVNYVGNTQMAPHSPALDPNGYERRKTKTVLMVSPDGVEEEVAADNVRDYERLRGYKKKAVALPPPVVGVEANRATAEDSTSPSVGQSKLDEVASAMTYLEALRAAATDAGIEIDKRWGVARLRQEITDKGVAVPERTDQEE